MTVHIHSSWKPGDPVDQFPIDQVINAIVTHGQKAPQSYLTLCPADNFVFVAGLFLAHKYAEEDIEECFDENMPHRDDGITILKRILNHFS